VTAGVPRLTRRSEDGERVHLNDGGRPWLFFLQPGFHFAQLAYTSANMLKCSVSPPLCVDASPATSNSEQISHPRFEGFINRKREDTVVKMSRTPSVLTGIIALAVAGFAQPAEKTIPAGTIVQVRTDQTIDSRSAAPGQVFTGLVAHNVTDRTGRVVIAGGSPAELVVRNVSKHKMVLDLQAIMIGHQRYHVLSDAATIVGTNKGDLGANKRTAKFVGGGALGGSVIGAIAGGGAGAAIGAIAGGAGGATAQVLTKGKSVHVPAESLVTFRLAHPLHT
jgi:hypothetical protein